MGRPKGARILCSLKIGGVQFYPKVKEGTQKLLGLTKISGKLPKAKKATARGIKGTRSYKLLLASRHEIGGFKDCVSVELPVSNEVKLTDFYAWAYKQSALAGIVTPWGIKYSWKTAAKSPEPNLLQKGLKGASDLAGGLVGDVGGLVGDAVDAAGAVGDFLNSAENAAGTVGGYINGVEGLAGDLITGAEALGGYLL